MAEEDEGGEGKEEVRQRSVARLVKWTCGGGDTALHVIVNIRLSSESSFSHEFTEEVCVQARRGSEIGPKERKGRKGESITFIFPTRFI